MDHIDFLLHSEEPWTVYRTLLDLTDAGPNSTAVIEAKKQMLAHHLVRQLLEELQEWPGNPISSHKSASQLFHKLSFLADIGVTVNDDSMRPILESVLLYRSREGILCLSSVIPQHYGGSGKEQMAWALCDAPLLLYSAVKIGGTAETGEGMKINGAAELGTSLKSGVSCLAGLARDNGWPCAVSKELGNFRGPGRKSDPCPYATLLMLKLLSLFPDLKNGQEAQNGVETLLSLWTNSLESHPYMFYMGTDFRKLKVPFIWYDLLHVTEILSLYESARRDPRFLEMVDLIHSKADENGRYAPESDWQAWKEMGFARKPQVSPWLTFLVERIDRRIET